MYNTIKAGIAVDYPIVDQQTMDGGEFTRTTGSAGAPATTHGAMASMHCSASYLKRLPFEAIIEPSFYAAKVLGSASIAETPRNAPNIDEYAEGYLHLFDMDPEVIIDSTASIQNTDGVYEAHAHNFFAEVPNFFLEKLSTIRSKPEKEWIFDGPLSSSEAGIKKFAMEVVIEKPVGFLMHSAPNYFGHWPYVHHVPPYYGANPEATCGPAATSKEPCRNANVITEGYASKYNKATFRITFDPTPIFEKYPERLAAGTFALDDIINNSTFTYENFQWKKYSLLSASMGMNLSASVDIFNITKNEDKKRWVINTKFETPIFNFADPLQGTGSNTVVMDHGGAYTGMWHQYGRAVAGGLAEGLYFSVKDSTPDLDTDTSLTGSLVDACGFNRTPVLLGEVAKSKLIYEAVVAIPFYTDQVTREEKFFNIPVPMYEESYQRAITGKVKTSIDDMLHKQLLNRYVFPPKYDFTRVRKKAGKALIKPNDFLPAHAPFAMYIFEFSHDLTQQELIDIWQNVMPSIGQHAKKQDFNIAHPIKKGEFFSKEMLLYNNLKRIPSNVRWKLFRVKQRANNDYFEMVRNYINNAPPNTNQKDFAPNWPYDFFSLIETGKMDVQFGFEKAVQKSKGEKSGAPINRKPLSRAEKGALMQEEIVNQERKYSDAGICRDRHALNYLQHGKCEYPHMVELIPEDDEIETFLCTDKHALNYNEVLPCRYDDARVPRNRPQLFNCPRDAMVLTVGNAASKELSIIDIDPGQGEKLQVDVITDPPQGTTFIEIEEQFNGKDGKNIIITAAPTDEAQVGNYFVSIEAADEDGQLSERCDISVIVNGQDGLPGADPGIGWTAEPPPPALEGIETFLPPSLQPTPTEPALEGDLFATVTEAVLRAEQIGCVGNHVMRNGHFMPCRSHEEYVTAVKTAPSTTAAPSGTTIKVTGGTLNVESTTAPATSPVTAPAAEGLTPEAAAALNIEGLPEEPEGPIGGGGMTGGGGGY